MKILQKSTFMFSFKACKKEINKITLGLEE